MAERSPGRLTDRVGPVVAEFREQSDQVEALFARQRCVYFVDSPMARSTPSFFRRNGFR